MSESFEESLEKVKECVDGVACWSYTPSGWCEGYEKCGDCQQAARQTIDRLKAAHEHELEQLRKTEYARGYEDGQRSMDAEHRAIAIRLMQLPLDEDSHGNLSQIARAVWHNDFGWTQDACRALRDELVRLLGGAHEPDAALPTYEELEDERQTAVCWLQDWDPHNSFDNDRQGEVHIRILYQLLDLGGAMMMDGADAAVAVRDKLIHLLGGDEPTLLKAATELSQASVDAMSGRAKSCESVEAIKSGGEYDGELMENGENHKIATITDELRECVEHATKSYDDTPWHEMDGTTEAEHTICYVTEAELTDIAEHIDAGHAKQCKLLDDSWQATCEQIMKDYEGETAEMRAAIVGYKERAAALEESERLRHELQAKLDEYDQTHMELPKDADGNRVTIGDTLHDNEDGHDFKVDGFEIWGSASEWWAYQDNGVQYPVNGCTLVHLIKPDPIERLVTQHTLGNLDEQQLIDQLREVMNGRD